MNKLILATGSEGLVGSRFIELSEHKDLIHAPKQLELDILDKAQIKAVFNSYDFGAVVNFAAYTDVNEAENQRGNKDGLCWKLNVEAVRNLAEGIKRSERKIYFVHISTDMVFSGSKKDKGPYDEKHAPETHSDQVTWYGYTKGRGEEVVREVLDDKATILRIIYPVRASFSKKLDYLRKPLKLFDEGKLYPMFKDQQVSISFIDEVSLVLDKLIKDKISGTFHAGSIDTSTPYQLVSYLIEKARGVKNVVKPTKLDDFIKSVGAPDYRYPKYGGLSVNDTENRLGIKFSSWKQIIDKLVEQGLSA